MSSSNIIIPSDDDEVQEYTGEKRIFIFSTTWCGPCKTYKKMWTSEAEKHPEVRFIYVDTDDCPETASKYAITTIPTTLVFGTNNEYERFGGADVNALRNAIGKLH